MVADGATKLRTARAILAELRAGARANGLGNSFVLASMAMSGHESAGYDPQARLATDPGPLGSVGPWQFNTAAHPDLTYQQMTDPTASTRLWFARQNPVAHYRACGGDDAFAADPSKFMQCYAPSTQVSDPWSGAMASAALALAGSTIDQIDTQPLSTTLQDSHCVHIANGFGGWDYCPPGAQDIAGGIIDALIGDAIPGTNGRVKLDWFTPANIKSGFMRGIVGLVGFAFLVGGVYLLVGGSSTVQAIAAPEAGAAEAGEGGRTEAGDKDYYHHER